MCGIIGYVGGSKASPLLFEALRRMEYRGYDSAGIATFDEGFVVRKGIGKVNQLNDRLNFLEMKGTIGIGHTRWATHGGVNDDNAHPHGSCKGEAVVVHNGIIENYLGLRDFLSSRGHEFKSQTDSEVIAHLIEESLQNHQDLKAAIVSTISSLKGSYAIIAMIKDQPDILIAARKDAPLILGVGKNENFISSDALGFIGRTSNAIFLDNREVAIVSRTGAEFFDFTGKEVSKSPTTLAWEISDVSKKEYLHFTLKEIHEQPVGIRKSLTQDELDMREFVNAVRNTNNLFITGCGTSYHSGLLFKYLLAKETRIRSEVFLSSEINQQRYLLDEDSVLIAISQSGETADVLTAVAEAKSRGAKVLSIVNVMGSSLARESTRVLFTKCGPEVGVAATKSFTSQVSLMCSIALSAASKPTGDLFSLPTYIGEALTLQDKVKEIADKYINSNDFYFVGRGDNYPIALEGALKLKELSYVHAEGLAAGELKHGTIALIENGTPVILLNPPDETYTHTLNSATELKSRGARIIGISTTNHPCYDDFIKLPSLASELLYSIVEMVPLQMLAYLTAVGHNLDPDYPRNLAKSVTVV